MGKTTLFHPISLNVLRGAADYCGWKFGKIRQINNEPERGRARYIAEIVSIPERFKGQSNTVVLYELQECFLDDIRMHWLRQNKAGRWYVDIQIDTSDKADHQDGSNRKKEIALDERN